ncbi:DUF4339 domain-containing protein [Luteimonas yindakuii]|uniref:DUF4339 domain-containing protein n=1 Tax=Luteimonas yindakuii TaxID=2565782 RepID=A0A4Z1R2A2_9GAMM|nr:GYF domain-containing protein [Luteimonas yindakuii]TKS53056.1 DUF4339 domain-containing protein [Luteimonas yindakuii]
MSTPRPDPACWHYRDPRGRACGPYDINALARLYRFGHLRADSEVWSDADPTPPGPLRGRGDAFRLHGDGRLEALATAYPDASRALGGTAVDAHGPDQRAGAAPPAAGPEPAPPVDRATASSAPDVTSPPRAWPWAAAVLLLLGLTLLVARLAS